MRAPSFTPIKHPPSPDPIITAASSLNLLIQITTTTTSIQPHPSFKPHLHQAHAKKKSKYRAIKRPGGMIVEYPRYLPALQFDKKQQHPPAIPSTTTTTTILSKPFKKQSRNSYTPINAEDLAAVGAHLTHYESDGYTPVDAGRGGYNGLFELQEEVREEVGGELMPMQRFLGEEGAWTGWGMG